MINGRYLVWSLHSCLSHLLFESALKILLFYDLHFIKRAHLKMWYFSGITANCEDREKQGCVYRGIATFKAERIDCCYYRPSRITSSDDHNLLLIVDPGSTELNEFAAPGKLHLVATTLRLPLHLSPNRRCLLNSSYSCLSALSEVHKKNITFYIFYIK